MPKPFPERMDDMVFDASLRIWGLVNKVMPEDAQLQTIVRSTFEALSPEQRKSIVDQLGTEWYLKLATRIERELARIDKAV